MAILKVARMGAVLQAIDRQFGDPRVSAETVGRGLGLSGRHVHRLLEHTTKTFNEHLLERRLARAHELLSDFDSQARIADVAFDAGFTSVAYFNQAFRRRFGDTPTGVRAIAARKRSLRVLRRSLGRK